MEWIPTSMRQAIVELSVGETYSKCERLPLDRVKREQIKSATDALRNTVNTAVRRAMSETSAHYTLETGNFLTQKGGLVIVACVTRTE